MTFRQFIVRRCVAALIACCLFATMLPVAAVTAESGIPAGSGAVITAGAPLAVRTAPGWDAAVAYEIANGAYVTVWDGEQAAPDPPSRTQKTEQPAKPAARESRRHAVLADFFRRTVGRQYRVTGLIKSGKSEPSRDFCAQKQQKRPARGRPPPGNPAVCR